MVKGVYGISRIHPPQVTLLLRHLKIDGDNVHCVVEKKMSRKYITRAGLKAVENFIRQHPGDAINTFGSRAAKNAYLLGKLKSMPVEAIFVPEEGVIHIAEPAEVVTKASS